MYVCIYLFIYLCIPSDAPAQNLFIYLFIYLFMYIYIYTYYIFEKNTPNKTATLSPTKRDHTLRKHTHTHTRWFNVTSWRSRVKLTIPKKGHGFYRRIAAKHMHTFTSTEEQMIELVSSAAEKAVPTAPLLELGGDGWDTWWRDGEDLMWMGYEIR